MNPTPATRLSKSDVAGGPLDGEEAEGEGRGARTNLCWSMTWD